MAKRLADLLPGQKGRITEIGGSGDAIRRLMDLGLIRGTVVQLIRSAPLGDPIEVKLRGFMLTLRRAEAELITVDG